jgi:hypothetical protein
VYNNSLLLGADQLVDDFCPKVFYNMVSFRFLRQLVIAGSLIVFCYQEHLNSYLIIYVNCKIFFFKTFNSQIGTHILKNFAIPWPHFLIWNNKSLRISFNIYMKTLYMSLILQGKYCKKKAAVKKNCGIYRKFTLE